MKRSIFFLSLVLYSLGLFAQPQHAHLTVQLNSLRNADSLILTLDKYGDINSSPSQRFKQMIVPVKNKTAIFDVPVSSVPLRFHIWLTKKENEDPKMRFAHVFIELWTMDRYLEAGDNILLTESNGAFTYSGKGAEKLKLADRLSVIETSFLLGDTYTFENIRTYLFQQDTILRQKLLAIKSAGPEISQAMKSTFEIDAMANYWFRFHQLLPPLKSHPQLIDSVKTLRQTGRLPIDTTQMNRNPFLIYSSAYALGLIEMYTLDSVLLVKKPFSITKGYQFFKTHYLGELREALVMQYIFRNKTTEGYSAEFAEDALTYLKIPDFRSFLTDLAAPARFPGAVYQFKLTDTSGKKVSMAEFKGKIMIADFWFTGCGPCRETGPILKRLEEEFEGKAVVFVSISADSKMAMWKKSVQEGIYTSGKAVNLYTQGLRFDHPMPRFFNVSGGPTLLLFDARGNYTPIPDGARFDNGQSLEKQITAELTK